MATPGLTATAPLFYTEEEVAGALGVDFATVARLVDEKHLPGLRISKKIIRIGKIAFDHWRKALPEGGLDALLRDEEAESLPRPLEPQGVDEAEIDALLKAVDIHDPSHRRAGGFVYFLQSVEGGLVKIGTASRPGQRIRTIQALCPLHLRTLRLIYGGQDLEGRLHRLFTEERDHHEWFRPTPRLIEWIRRLPDERLLEGIGRHQRYRACPACQWRGDMGGRMFQRCRGCGRYSLETRCAYVCRVCGEDVIDTEEHLKRCRENTR